MQSITRVNGHGFVLLVEEHVEIDAKADFDHVLHHGLLDECQVDIQVRHQQRVGELDNCATCCNNEGIALASGDKGRDALLSGYDHHIGLGSHAKRASSACR
eukprot:6178072-Pleurochrysis_carterae.AAC.4